MVALVLMLGASEAYHADSALPAPLSGFPGLVRILYGRVEGYL